MTLTVSGDEIDQKVQKIQKLIKDQIGMKPSKSEAVRIAVRNELNRLNQE